MSKRLSDSILVIYFKTRFFILLVRRLSHSAARALALTLHLFPIWGALYRCEVYCFCTPFYVLMLYRTVVSVPFYLFFFFPFWVTLCVICYIPFEALIIAETDVITWFESLLLRSVVSGLSWNWLLIAKNEEIVWIFKLGWFCVLLCLRLRTMHSENLE